MEYVLTQKGLCLPVIMPIVYQIMLIISMQREMKPKERKRITVGWYLLAVLTEAILYICKFDLYVCYIWILVFGLGYPVLYGFEKLGDRLNADLTAEEWKHYNQMTDIFRKIAGVIILAFVFMGGVERFIANKLDKKIVILSEILYAILGVLLICGGTLKKNKGFEDGKN